MKFQIPISKSQTNLNNQNTNRSNKVLFGCSNLDFGYCLEFGVCDL